jgi:uncharacterized membrane protein
MTVGRFLIGIVLVCYPLIVYLMLDDVGPALLGIILVLLLLIRGGIWIRHKPALAWGSLALAVIAVGLLLIGDTAIVLKLYPVLINLGLLATFAYTLFHPPSMIERIARTMRAPLSTKAEPYTRIVTMIWCGFFIVNGIIATLVAISGSLSAWTLYNGFIAYIIVGVLILGEFIFRHFYKRHHGLHADQP